ncbi:RagB/SusD family nutrient uptake outer membrane protein [Chitinophaga nivalis]|uniref:RagB/SusD family nutrient uptake outer membrane protein n=1 Tax=Chitinophaga nivalis TaxID=2991709 RepID=A0ABT3IKR4_9BACT|nr:RagB/SusD family nutrient uptake outer membrane protein [Chitinophaga nivalis]MCW3465764.1 RagB/SusD family nutrient uptake outer membrane protein [Chitinophaga nivalis]MCW3484545.1 RagB/SusD family nutrient uptake outer membrane protein [Chitinophaga nivalis]
MALRNQRLYICMLILVALSACRKLDVDVASRYTPSNFPTNGASYAAAVGAVYSQLANSKSGDPTYFMNGTGFSYGVDYWMLQELSTDEAFIPARDGNWDDGGKYRFLHLHTWSSSLPFVISTWQWGFGGINIANNAINLVNAAPGNSQQATYLAELRTMRSLFYFFMMDLYGNVPIIDTFPVTTLPATQPRAAVFAFIENTLKKALPDLPVAVNGSTYGRATKWMAYALLEKMYLNAQYYTGTPRYTDAIAMADSILINAPYSLDADYMAVFKPENGPQIQETIFAIPYDANLIPGNHFTRFGLHPFLKARFDLPEAFGPSIALSTIPDFYARFNLPGDVRNNTWLAGKQTNKDGSVMKVRTSTKTLDATYTGPDTPIDWEVVITPELPLKKGGEGKLDVGNDLLAQLKGARSIKFYPDKNINTATRFQNNDIPVFRLADVLLMKAEAILRGGAPTTVKGELQTADVLVNKIRNRAHTSLVSDITLNELLDERAREMAWEGWRRNDLIRFGKFEDKWGFKEKNNETFRRIFPIPAIELSLNPRLIPNPGY